MVIHIYIIYGHFMDTLAGSEGLPVKQEFSCAMSIVVKTFEPRHMISNNVVF